MKYLLAIVALFALGCGGGGGQHDVTAPPAGPAEPPPTDAPTTPPVPEPPVSEPGAPLDPHQGQVTLRGAGFTGGEAMPSPATVTMPGTKATEFAIITLTANAASPDLHSMASLAGPGHNYSVMPVITNGQPRHFFRPLREEGDLNLSLYNQAEMTTPQNVSDITWDYTFYCTTPEDAGEPGNNNMNSPEALPENETVARSFYKGPGHPDDATDFFQVALDGARRYTLTMTNSNGWWDTFRFNLALSNDQWAMEWMDWDFAEDTKTVTFVPSQQGVKNYNLKVQGFPNSGDPRAARYAQYWLKLDSAPINAPLLTGVTDSLGASTITARTNELVTFVPTVQLDASAPHTWAWNFGSGTTPTVSNKEKPKVTFLAPGTYTGSVTVTNGAGTSLPLEFTYTVERGTPLITAGSPTGAQPVFGNLLEFSATAFNEPTSWNWTFDASTIPATSTEEHPQVNFTTTGQHKFTVTTSNELGTSPEFKGSVTITPAPAAPVVTAVDVPSGTTLESITLTATVDSATPLTTWEWSFNALVSPATSTAAEPVLQLKTVGKGTASVRVSNAAGSSNWFPFTLYVDSNTPVAWSNQTLIGDQSFIGRPVLFPTATGFPAAVFLVQESSTSNTIRLARALVADPTAPGDWVISQVTPTLGSLPGGLSALELNGRIAIAYHNATTQSFVVALANTEDPRAPGDWTHVVVSNHGVGTEVGRDCTLLVAGGRLAASMVIRTPSNIWDVNPTMLQASIATTDWPTTAGDWISHVVNPVEATTLLPRGTVLNDRLAVAYQGPNKSLRYATANVAAPASATDWTLSLIASNQGMNSNSELLMRGGRPILAFTNPADSTIRLAQGLVPAPTGPGDWRFAGTGLQGGTSSIPAIALVNGHLTLGVVDPTTKFLMLGWTDAAQPEAGDWVLQPLGISHPMRGYTAILDLNGRARVISTQMDPPGNSSSRRSLLFFTADTVY